MNDNREHARKLSASLSLSLPPIAIALRDEAPEGVPSYSGGVPAGCAFWEQAARSTFATSARDHEMCAIGVHTHRMSKPSRAQAAELKSTLRAMSGLDYVRDEEVEAIPVMQREVGCAIYGPLAEFPTPADVVLLFGHSRQGLILSEAVSRVDGGAPPAMGRPACAIVPQVMNNGAAAMSLGCCGARAYLDVLSDSIALWALPAPKIDRYCREVTTLARGNQVLTRFHQRRRSDIANGEKPTVDDSLSRVS